MTRSAFRAILDRQSIERFVEGQQVLRPFGRGRRGLIEIQTIPISAAAQRRVPPGALDQDPPHRLGRRGEEVATAVPAGILGTDQPQVSLMHQGRRLERLPGRFPGEPLGGQPAELAVNQREQLLGGSRSLPARLPRVSWSSRSFFQGNTQGDLIIVGCANRSTVAYPRSLACGKGQIVL